MRFGTLRFWNVREVFRQMLLGMREVGVLPLWQTFLVVMSDLVQLISMMNAWVVWALTMKILSLEMNFGRLSGVNMVKVTSFFQNVVTG